MGETWRAFTSAGVFLAVAGLMGSAAPARAADLPAGAARLHAALASKPQPTVRAWIGEEARKLSQAPPASVDEGPLRAAIQSRFAGQSLGDQDIEALAFLVLMQATSDMDKDLKAIMAEVQALNGAKQKLRELADKARKQVVENAGRKGTDRCAAPVCGGLQPAGAEATAALRRARVQVTLTPREPATVGELRAVADDVKGKLDSMNEMSEMTSLRLQMMMDRRSKFISTLSNIMKKISSTQDTLVQNLK